MIRDLAISAFVTAVILCSPSAAQSGAPRADLQKAEELYQTTYYEESLKLLDQHSPDSQAMFLVARDYFMLGDFKKSAEYLQKIVAGDPNNSEYTDWLGRVYGKRAETSNPLAAPVFASKARQLFERSVALNPKNSDALSDLFEFYLAAPGFMGGGYDKAAALAEQIMAVDVPEGFVVKAELAQKRKEYSSAEEHWKRAIAAAPQQVGPLISFARLLADQGRIRESDNVFGQALRVNPKAASVWFARADVLIKQKRNLDEARELLQKYVKAPTTVDDPPKQEAFRLLKQVGGA
jgi:tetratricopeptide (TPR) repeat protein